MNRVNTEMDREYEYIVVGSGAGGGPVAANLAKAGHSVLVLEAGGPPEADLDYEYGVPAFHTLASEKKSMSWSFFVRHYQSEEQQRRDPKYCANRGGVFYPRAGTLGGCTSHNAMILMYPSNRDWDAIADETGDESWRSAYMRGYFERVECCQYRPIKRAVKRLLGFNPSRHGYEGWLSASMPDPKLVLDDQELVRTLKGAVHTAFWRLAGKWAYVKSKLKTFLDPNDYRAQGLEGIWLTPLSTLRGKRVGTRELLLGVQAKQPDKLTIRTDALVTRVLFDAEKRATGVEYLEGRNTYRASPEFRDAPPGALRRVTATREVILAGGTFNTPQLLQLSGIGPSALLQKHGIPVLVDLPGVGANLQDRYEVSVVNKLKRPLRLLEGATMRPPVAPALPDRFLRQWIDTGGGVYTSNGAVIGVVKKSKPSRPDPDILIFGLATNFRGYYPGYSNDVSNARDFFTWTILKGYTRNTAGHVAIRSSNPQDVPHIDFSYFEKKDDPAGEDVDAVVDAILFARAMTDPYRAKYVAAEEVPGDALRTHDELRQFVRDQAWGHHASGTCKIGRPEDPMAVLDSRFRVYGTKNLRVVDASIFPRIPGLFIVAAVYTAAEKASDVIRADVEHSRR